MVILHTSRKPLHIEDDLDCCILDILVIVRNGRDRCFEHRFDIENIEIWLLQFVTVINLGRNGYTKGVYHFEK